MAGPRTVGLGAPGGGKGLRLESKKLERRHSTEIATSFATRFGLCLLLILTRQQQSKRGQAARECCGPRSGAFALSQRARVDTISACERKRAKPRERERASLQVPGFMCTLVYLKMP